MRHKKGREDAKRGKIFTKLIRELSIAARLGGSDPESNPRLRQAIDAAKSSNMPNDNIERAIKKGAGGADGAAYEEVNFEGYGPAGVAVLVEAQTDNRNRTVSELRHFFDRYNGKLGEAGCVSWMFDKRGLIMIDKSDADEDTVMDIALDAGAEDIRGEGDFWEVLTSTDDYESVKQAFDAKGVPHQGRIAMIPQTTVQLSGKSAEQMLKLMEALEDLDDVQNVWANFDIPDEEMERLSA
ncbi:MAG: YebC/PmpR family DNA-binding transcriptional regulator [bacterium]